MCDAIDHLPSLDETPSEKRISKLSSAELLEGCSTPEFLTPKQRLDLMTDILATIALRVIREDSQQNAPAQEISSK